MTLHYVALPHTRVEPSFCGCAYTGKALKFCKMMGDRHTIFIYAPEGPAVPGATLVPCLSDAERQATFGADDPARLPAWPTDAQTAIFNLNAITQLKANATKADLVLLSAGRTHLPISKTLPELFYCEPGVGYEGFFSNFCAFESYAWMHYLYGKFGVIDGRWFDSVIPNYFDPEEFPKLNDGNGQYLGFLGRRIERKGLRAAADLAKACGERLFVAGAGDLKVDGDVEYLGPLNVKQRARFLAGAKALIVPTYYVEPFGGVAVEAMMCGTPVISSDFGAFTETVREGVSGYRFRTLKSGVAAVEMVGNLVPQQIRDYALDNYSLSAVGKMFDSWFARLDSLRRKGWYELT